MIEGLNLLRDSRLEPGSTLIINNGQVLIRSIYFCSSDSNKIELQYEITLYNTASQMRRTWAETLTYLIEKKIKIYHIDLNESSVFYFGIYRIEKIKNYYSCSRDNVELFIYRKDLQEILDYLYFSRRDENFLTEETCYFFDILKEPPIKSEENPAISFSGFLLIEFESGHKVQFCSYRTECKTSYVTFYRRKWSDVLAYLKTCSSSIKTMYLDKFGCLTIGNYFIVPSFKRKEYELYLKGKDKKIAKLLRTAPTILELLSDIFYSLYCLHPNDRQLWFDDLIETLILLNAATLLPNGCNLKIQWNGKYYAIIQDNNDLTFSGASYGGYTPSQEALSKFSAVHSALKKNTKKNFCRLEHVCGAYDAGEMKACEFRKPNSDGTGCHFRSSLGYCINYTAKKSCGSE